MTNSERNMGILVSYNTSLDFVNITASGNNGSRSVLARLKSTPLLETMKVQITWFFYGANMIRTHTVYQPHN